jgi:hypothetical protein
MTKSPVAIARPLTVGWKLIEVERPIDGGIAIPSSVTCSARAKPNL